MQLLSDAHPDAIFTEDQTGNLPVDLATVSDKDAETIVSLQTQLTYVLKAKDKQAVTTPKDNGRLPLRYALFSTACPGAVKFIVKGNNIAPQGTDKEDGLPIPFAYCLRIWNGWCCSVLG